MNSTFYRLASRDAVARWVEQTPPGFVFAAKASRYLTHVRRLREIEQGIERYYERIEPLVAAGKLGPIVWQLPAASPNLELLAATLALLPCRPPLLRGSATSWFTDELYALLADHGAALVIGDHPRWPFQARELTADWTLVRLHFGSRGRRGNYSATELDEWARRIAGWRRQAEVSSTSTTTGGVRRRERSRAQAAAAAVSSRVSARRSRRDTCICE